MCLFTGRFFVFSVHSSVLVINVLFVVIAGYGVEVVMVGVVSGGGSSEGRRPRDAAPHSSSNSSRAHKSRGSPFPRPLGLATLVLVLAAFARAEQGKLPRHCSPNAPLGASITLCCTSLIALPGGGPEWLAAVTAAARGLQQTMSR